MHKLIVSIVPKDSGSFISNAANAGGARGGTIALGRGTASNGILQLLGFGDSAKELVYNIVDEKYAAAVCKSIETAAEQKKAHFGVLFTMKVGLFAKAGDGAVGGAEGQESESSAGVVESAVVSDASLDSSNVQTANSAEKGENMNGTYQVINVIVNKGYAEDAMAAARKAGAGGGTIMNARGTAREGDAKFFGMEIVPEKEMLMILVPTEKAEGIVNAIRELPCFAKAGSGIVFCNEANDFTLLGKK